MAIFMAANSQIIPTYPKLGWSINPILPETGNYVSGFIGDLTILNIDHLGCWILGGWIILIINYIFIKSHEIHILKPFIYIYLIIYIIFSGKSRLFTQPYSVDRQPQALAPGRRSVDSTVTWRLMGCIRG
jgi:hypothetical protein